MVRYLFYEHFPEAGALLALEPESLGIKLLIYYRERGCSICISNLREHMEEPVKRGEPDKAYSNQEKEQCFWALAEALNWLVAAGFIIRDWGQHEEYFRLTRRAEKIEREEDLHDYSMARMIPREMMHSSLPTNVWTNFVAGEYATAVFSAMRQVEISVREASGHGHAIVGVDLMRKAFHPETGPLRKVDDETAEREALMHLFAGAIGSYKNPHSHRRVDLEDPMEAAQIIMLANHLLQIVESRKP